ncbi:MAG: class I SAM-dependent methyltransferase [Pseudomonadota bacterium]
MAVLPSIDDTTEALDLTVRGFLFCLRRDAEGRLTLAAPHLEGYGAFAVDWASPEVQRRITGGKKQLLAKAVGLHKKPSAKVFDGTGGLGRDAFTLAALGAEVTLAERNPVLLALLRDAHRRALLHSSLRDAATRIRIIEHDSTGPLLAAQGADAIYLDPMYPDDGKRALPSKEMQILRDLTGGDADADALLAAARASGVARVAVKRPSKAPWLAGSKPHLSLEGTQARFDIYLG